MAQGSVRRIRSIRDACRSRTHRSRELSSDVVEIQIRDEIIVITVVV
jgi:hypothetical protein